MTTTAGKGRPRESSLDRAALHATLALVETEGYDGLRMKDVAAAAHIGLGALYRRWPSKQALVVAALRSRSDELDLVATDDPRADLGRVLRGVRRQLLRGGRFVLPPLLIDHDSELSRAIVKAKVEPLHRFLRDRLRAELGPVEDLRLRAELGPALITYRMMTTGAPPSDREITFVVVPRMLERPSRRTSTGAAHAKIRATKDRT